MRITGNGAGSTEGGEIRLDTAADYDTTYDYYFMDAFQDDLRIGRAGVGSDVVLSASGNLGVGTASPTEKLEVTGNMQIPMGNYIKFGDNSLPEFNSISSRSVSASYGGGAGGNRELILTSRAGVSFIMDANA